MFMRERAIRAMTDKQYKQTVQELQANPNPITDDQLERAKALIKNMQAQEMPITPEEEAIADQLDRDY